MRELLVSNPGSLGLLVYLILGAAYYMAATALMKGSIFEDFRQIIEEEAEWSKFFDLLKRMLGCMMCTAMELALWTAGLMTLVIGLYFHAADEILAALLEALGVIGSKQPIVIPWWIEIPLMFAIAIAVSFAIAAEAWLIKTFFEHREEQFLALRDEFRQQEEDLLRKISSLRRKLASGSGNVPLNIREVLIPLEEFEDILASLRKDQKCRWIWCPYSRTTCFVRRTNEAVRRWVLDNNRDPEAVDIYDLIFKNAIRVENQFYWGFWVGGIRSAEDLHEELAQSVQSVIEGQNTEAAI